MFTNDPLHDFHMHDAEMERKLQKAPKCAECGRPIQDERLFDIDGELYHVKCFEEQFLKWTDDYEE